MKRRTKTKKFKWPSGTSSERFKRQVAQHAETILNKTLLVIDPSSGGEGRDGSQSYPGFALYDGGVMVKSGVVTLDKRDPIPKRLFKLHRQLETLFNPPEILVVEQLRGRMCHTYLTWAVGAIIASVGAPVLLEIPIGFWKVMCEEGYVKGDEADACKMGQAILTLAGGK